MTKRLVYGYGVGVCSAREIEQRVALDGSKGKANASKHQAMVEPVFGQSKQARGFRRFSMRGLATVQAERALVCATHNILKLYRLCYG